MRASCYVREAVSEKLTGRNAEKRPTGCVLKCLLRDVHGDPVGPHYVAYVPVRAHRPVVAEVLYAGLQREHVPAGLRSGYPRLIRCYLLEARNPVGVGGPVDVAEVDHIPPGQKRQIVELVVAGCAWPAEP